MMKAEVLDLLCDLFEMPAGTLSESSELREIKTFDSIKFLELIAFADEQWGLELSPEQLKSAASVGDLLQLFGVGELA